MMMARRPLLVWCALMFTLVSCSDTSAPRERRPATIMVHSGVSELALGEHDSLQLRADVLAAGSVLADSQSVRWASLDTTMATVDARGVVVPASRIGTAVITASSTAAPEVVGTARIVVARSPEAVVLSPAAVGAAGIGNAGTLSVGEEMTATASGMISIGGKYQTWTADNVLQRVVWVSRDPSIATVESTGHITARTPGMARIVATSIHQPYKADSATVTVLAAPLRFTAIAVGGQACALTESLAAYCWGGNASDLGAGDLTAHIGPTRVTTSVAFRAISVGGGARFFGARTCAISTDDALYCWGELTGGASDGTSQYFQPVPARVSGGPARYKAVSAGGSSTCALDQDGSAYCWGDAYFGLGEGTTTADPAVTHPAAVHGGLRFTSISVGGPACAIATDSTTYCWGLTPAAVPGGIRFVELAVGSSHACGRTTEGAVYCWNTNPFTSIGQGGATPMPTLERIQGGLTFSTIVAGHDAPTCGMTASGVYCWTYTQGTQPDGSPYAWTTPTPVPTPLRFNGIAMGYFLCGLANGKAYCWGSNIFGQLGDNSGVDQATPVAVGGQWP